MAKGSRIIKIGILDMSIIIMVNHYLIVLLARTGHSNPSGGGNFYFGDASSGFSDVDRRGPSETRPRGSSSESATVTELIVVGLGHQIPAGYAHSLPYTHHHRLNSSSTLLVGPSFRPPPETRLALMAAAIGLVSHVSESTLGLSYGLTLSEALIALARPLTIPLQIILGLILVGHSSSLSLS
ncbi:hypothetical protein L2E82_18254 [Cichorium intybus]|uniref:Uncharacterized protein n=1 Tax=Cichorium intybus TaxID=13427 RepID=A0ACB9F9V5_CICIN|nr:hypothetical protein L2E82_18254 [Cichorium intybus]